MFCIPVRRCPSSPPAPFSHTGRRGSLGVLMAETGDGAQGLAKKSTPVSSIPILDAHAPIFYHTVMPGGFNEEAACASQ